jgi:hypothetical protein
VLADIPEGFDAVWLCLSLSIVRHTELALFGLYHFCFSSLRVLLQIVLEFWFHLCMRAHNAFRLHVEGKLRLRGFRYLVFSKQH